MLIHAIVSHTVDISYDDITTKSDMVIFYE